jgi:pimeloyl-ACP methyl ester carboxylesterase
VTPYDRLALSDTQVESLLVTGEHSQELIAYFGQEEYRELARLARGAAATRTKPDAGRTIIVPGIMGTQLGLLRRAPLPPDILWLDPVDISSGRLTALIAPRGSAIQPLGVVLYSYLRLKLLLRICGLDAVFHDYDWRRGIDELGRELAARLAAEPPGRLSIVAHSMGGLVARAALAQPGTAKVERLVLLGVPNFGSFAVVQALRGTYSVVRKIARVDAVHSAETLAGDVFATFPSLYHMLPPAGYSGATDLFDPACWPQSGPQPSPELLAQARTIGSVLAPPDERVAVIVGIDQETVTAVRRRRDDFVYTITRHGDGTVPTASARLPGARTYHASVSHSELTRSAVVARAVADLVATGVTRRLQSRVTRSGTACAHISDTALRKMHVDKIVWTALDPEERRIYLQNLNEPPNLKLRDARSKKGGR